MSIPSAVQYPVFFEDDEGGWWWYHPDKTRARNAIPTHGPFDIEALARKHCVFLLRQLRAMGYEVPTL
jgi:hypothetical protein